MKNNDRKIIIVRNLDAYSVGVYSFDNENDNNKCLLTQFDAWNVTTVIQPPWLCKGWL